MVPGCRLFIVGRAGSPVTAVPADGTDYTSNLSFGSGQEILPGQFVLTDGNQIEAAITNLQPSTTYYFSLFEYDGIGVNIRYFTTPGSASHATISAPLAGPTNVLFSSIGTTTATINWTSAIADKHFVVVRKSAPVTAMPQQLTAYSSSTSFGHTGSLLAPEHSVVFNSSGSSVNVTALQPGTTYHVSVFAFNGVLGPMYNVTNIASSSFTTLGPPTHAASGMIVASAGNGTSVNISWTNGSGQKRLVLMKAATAVDVLPAENTSYVANNFFGSGQQLGTGNFAVYNGTADNITVNNLQKNQIYHIAVFEYNQFATGPIYLTTAFAQGQFTGVTLPVKLNAFTGVANASGNVLKWTTSQEISVKEFVVERSANSNSFETIGTVAAKGNSSSSQSYQFEDRSRSAINFYRLRMVDVNGKVEFSSVIRLQTAKEEGLKLFPTVATSSVQLNINVAEQITASIRVIDMGGRLIVQQVEKLDAGVVSKTIDVSRLVTGTYLMQVQIGEKQVTERFIKQ